MSDEDNTMLQNEGAEDASSSGEEQVLGDEEEVEEEEEEEEDAADNSTRRSSKGRTNESDEEAKPSRSRRLKAGSAGDDWVCDVLCSLNPHVCHQGLRRLR
jgi:hypothetical protein